MSRCTHTVREISPPIATITREIIIAINGATLRPAASMDVVVVVAVVVVVVDKILYTTAKSQHT